MAQNYCLFYKNNKLQFGWVRGEQKNKLVIQPEQGKEFNCPENRLEYLWPGKAFAGEKDMQADVAEKAAWAMTRSLEFEWEVIYELCEPGQGYSLQQMADSFLEDPEDGWLTAALLIGLKNDSRRFQQKKNTFWARSPLEIARLVEEETIRQQNDLKVQREREWAEQLTRQTRPLPAAEEEAHWKQFLNRFKNFLIYLERSQERDYFCDLFHCNLHDLVATERRLLGYLALTDLKMSWGCLMLKRALGDSFAAAIEPTVTTAICDPSLQPSRDQSLREDQRSLEVFTVDGEDTRDFDDALSWDFTGSEALIRVHIADVASYVQKGDPLFETAEKQMSSLYTVKGVYPMFPAALSENAFSLIAGADRPVVTFEFSLADDGQMTRSVCYRSVVRIRQNLTYDWVDQAIAEVSSDWSKLWDIGLKLKNRRIAQGSLELDRVEIKLDVSRPDDIRIKEIRENTPATMLIQELAILTNHQAALFCRQRQIPCFYRTQPPYVLIKEPEVGQNPTLRDISIQPARIVLEPDSHSALGLDCYLQTTSPIRRFLDLVNQQIILDGLSEAPARYSREELLMWAKRGEETQREYAQVEKRLLDHWKVKYVAQHSQDIYEAEFIRSRRDGKAWVNLTALQLYAEGWIDGKEPGQRLSVEIERVDLQSDRVSVRETRSGLSSGDLVTGEQTAIV